MDSKYKCVKFLGQGGYGKVYLCKDDSGKFVCLKEILLKEAIYKSIKREVYILSQLNHPRIIKFIEYILKTDTIYIVMEYASAGSLREYIRHQRSRIKTESLMNIFMDIVMGLEYLHIRHVIHGDLKPENLLLSENKRIKICDFGISTVNDGSQCSSKGLSGTPLYIAPEVAGGLAPNFKSDIWSLGCVFYELCTFEQAFGYAHSFFHLKEIFKKWEKDWWDCGHLMYSDEIKILCECMLTLDPHKRISLPGVISNKIIWPKYYTLYFDYEKHSL